MKTIDDALKYADTFDKPANKHMSIVMLASEVRRLRDEINGLTGSLDRAEKALKEAQEQEPVAFWWIGPDGKDNGGPYRGKPSDAAIDNALNMGCEPVLLYARPVHAAPAAPVLGAEDQLATLMRFYQVSDIPSLALAQAKHIERLQAKLPAMRDDMPRNPRGA